ncbi:MAG: radical SAM protein [Gemmatimonadota bacterium]|nr:radical SAM protein [Gemmatimonadota bacterium]
MSSRATEAIEEREEKASPPPAPAFERTGPGVASSRDPGAAPRLEPGHLDALWFQVTGTVCNIECTHCFISCSPRNRSFDYLTVEDVRRRLMEAETLGVREFYFTGGEPFIHPDIVTILSAALAHGPTTVLTNGMVVKPGHVDALAEAAAGSPYSLEFRVSIDGFDAESHDAIRGAGSFEKAIRGLGLLLEGGFLPIVTAVRTWDWGEEPDVYRGFVEMLRSLGYRNPRIKLMPALKIGAEAERSEGYRPYERVTHAMLEDYDLDQLICSSARVVTDRGIWVCPILLEAEDGNLGEDLTTAADTPFRLAHEACYTCWEYGAICSNPGVAAPEDARRSEPAGGPGG